jgi:hypothetical protein
LAARGEPASAVHVSLHTWSKSISGLGAVWPAGLTWWTLVSTGLAARGAGGPWGRPAAPGAVGVPDAELREALGTVAPPRGLPAVAVDGAWARVKVDVQHVGLAGPGAPAVLFVALGWLAVAARGGRRPCRAW